MSIIRPGLFLVMQRFPNKKDELRHMYLTSQTFQAFCDDYHKCTNALEYWTRSDHEEAEKRSREYRELRENLESEIMEIINGDEKPMEK